LAVPIGEVLSSQAVLWMLSYPGPGWVLHANGVVPSPWDMVSGVRFSWMTRMTCWKDEIWAEAGDVTQSAASAKGNSRSTDSS
jgi:hypothetical protein